MITLSTAMKVALVARIQPARLFCYLANTVAVLDLLPYCPVMLVSNPVPSSAATCATISVLSPNDHPSTGYPTRRLWGPRCI